MKIRSPLLANLLARLVARLLRLLLLTVRFKLVASPETNPFIESGPDRYSYSLWHSQILLAVFGGRHLHLTALVSKHDDGSFLTVALEYMKIRPVRGSSTHGGRVAVRRLIEVSKTQHIAITPDGPRGPREKMTKGVAYLSSRAAHPIIPCAFTCAKHWTIKGNWTDMIVPKPFTKAYMVFGNPIQIPPDASSSQLDGYTEIIQAAMNQVNDHAIRLARGQQR